MSTSDNQPSPIDFSTLKLSILDEDEGNSFKYGDEHPYMKVSIQPI